MVKLKAPEGACSVCCDGVEYTVEKGFVEVDPAHAQGLFAHGFEVVVAEEKAPKNPRTGSKAPKKDDEQPDTGAAQSE